MGMYCAIDAAANANNKKCSSYITEEMNALTKDWISFAHTQGLPPIFWLNPPYSQQLLGRFITKAYYESQRGATVLLLIPNSNDTQWYRDIIQPLRNDPFRCQQVQDYPGRIKFIPPPHIDPDKASPRAGSLMVRLLPGKLHTGAR